MNATTTRAPVGDNCAAGRPPPRPRPAWPTPRRHPVAIGLSPLKPPSGSAASTSTLTWSPCTRQHRVPRTIRTSPRTLPAHHPSAVGGGVVERGQHVLSGPLGWPSPVEVVQFPALAGARRGTGRRGLEVDTGGGGGGAGGSGVADQLGGGLLGLRWPGSGSTTGSGAGQGGVSDPAPMGALTWGTSRNLLHGGQTQQRGSWGAWWQTTLHNYCDTALLH